LDRIAVLRHDFRLFVSWFVFTDLFKHSSGLLYPGVAVASDVVIAVSAVGVGIQQFLVGLLEDISVLVDVSILEFDLQDLFVGIVAHASEQRRRHLFTVHTWFYTRPRGNNHPVDARVLSSSVSVAGTAVA